MTNTATTTNKNNKHINTNSMYIDMHFRDSCANALPRTKTPFQRRRGPWCALGTVAGGSPYSCWEYVFCSSNREDLTATKIPQPPKSSALLHDPVLRHIIPPRTTASANSLRVSDGEHAHSYSCLVLVLFHIYDIRLTPDGRQVKRLEDSDDIRPCLLTSIWAL